MPPEAHLLTGTGGSVLLWSDTARRLTGHEDTGQAPAVMPGLAVPTALHGPIHGLMEQALGGGRGFLMTVLRQKDGTMLWARLECWKVEQDGAEHLAWRLEDHTAKKTARAAEILGVRHSRFLEVLPDAVLVVDVTAHVVYASQSTELLTGQKPGHLVGRSAREVLEAGEELEAHCLTLAGMTQVQPGSALLRVDTRLRTKEPAAVRLSMRLFDSDSEAGVLWLLMMEREPGTTVPRVVRASQDEEKTSPAGTSLFQELREEVLQPAPIHPDAADTDASQEAAAQTEALEEEPAAELRERPLVLLVDDEAAMRDILAMHLQGDFDVISARNGQEGFEMARERLPDLVLSDIRMPVRNGLELCQDLRGEALTRGIPLVMLTATDDQAMKLDCLAAGATDFLSKPCSGAELLLRARNLSRMHRQQQELTVKTRSLEQALSQVRQKDEMLVRQDRLAALGRMSAGLIHEINNPLNYCMQGLGLLRQSIRQLPEEHRAEFTEVVGDIEEGIGRVARIVGDLRGFATSPARAVHQPTGLASVVQMAVKHLSHAWGPVCTPEVVMPEDFCVLADKHQMVQVMVNLVKNALDAIAAKTFTEPDAPALRITTERIEDHARLTIQDNGIGMEPDVCAHIFEPFFTTKEVGQGLGLGLSICHSILSEHGVKVHVRSEPGVFTQFILDFPLPAMSDL